MATKADLWQSPSACSTPMRRCVSGSATPSSPRLRWAGSGTWPGPRYVGTRSPYLNSCDEALATDAPRSLYPGGSWLLMLSLADAAAAFSAAPIFSCEALRLL